MEDEYSLTKGLKICENCEWAIDEGNNRFLKCLLSGSDQGLTQTCKRFEKKTGEYITKE
ncbi:MAG: hypothetical protein HFJ51_00030 [Clostridia bacterium]|nr:hypothetical protein [Clostridia bacterium]